MDKDEIMKLDEMSLRERLSIIIDKVKGIDDDDPKEESDPRIGKLLEEGRLICNRLDPIVRERLRDDPVTIAEWDEIIHMCDDLEEGSAKDCGQSPAD